MLPSPDSHLSHHTGDILLVLGREVGRDLHQQGRLVRALQGVPRLLHLEQHAASDEDPRPQLEGATVTYCRSAYFHINYQTRA